MQLVFSKRCFIWLVSVANRRRLLQRYTLALLVHGYIVVGYGSSEEKKRKVVG
jgi:hypothetical protein